ncbi:transcription factor HES-5-like [Xiphias gladius]|uniref:transcription factor HES-5-like n=1 Tax=Xiphias gladius TaxID=8245 RepID=UPI001A99B40F|nr:transcription factor HES-5-like [Xiphias gladius]
MAPVAQTTPEDKPASVDNSGSNKLRKLTVEKVRRDRINRSIERLGALLNRGEPSGGQPPSRLEKADILEMAVSFLRQRALARVAPSSSRGPSRGFSRGFSQCLQETLRHLSLHAPLQPAEREEIKRFYVRQRAALQRHVSGEQGRRTVSRKRAGYRSPARSHGSLWRPW